MCFHNFGTGDPDDITALQKSVLYDIRDEETTISIPLDNTFQEEVKRGLSGTNYRLLLVPNSVSMSQFSTLHEAYGLGIRVLGTGGGPP